MLITNSMKTEIDYLIEDQPVSGQRFALVSIVGPNMNQKCDVWGLKVRGTCDSVDKAKQMTKKLLRADPDYDIYTVEVGKFFPLQVEPNEIQEVEYQNEQLNQLVKNYVENKESANEHWNERREKLVKQAVADGKNQEEINAKPEHPVSLLQRMQNYEKTIKDQEDDLKTLQQDLLLSRTKFETMYSDEERETAVKELESAIKDVVKETPTEMSVEEIREQLMRS
jgi:hypothetical protein